MGVLSIDDYTKDDFRLVLNAANGFNTSFKDVLSWNTELVEYGLQIH